MKINLKVVKNKSNKQYSCSLPKKQLPLELIKNMDKGKKIRLKVSGWSYT